MTGARGKRGCTEEGQSSTSLYPDAHRARRQGPGVATRWAGQAASIGPRSIGPLARKPGPLKSPEVAARPPPAGPRAPGTCLLPGPGGRATRPRTRPGGGLRRRGGAAGPTGGPFPIGSSQSHPPVRPGPRAATGPPDCTGRARSAGVARAGRRPPRLTLPTPWASAAYPIDPEPGSRGEGAARTPVPGLTDQVPRVPAEDATGPAGWAEPTPPTPRCPRVAREAAPRRPGRPRCHPVPAGPVGSGRFRAPPRAARSAAAVGGALATKRRGEGRGLLRCPSRSLASAGASGPPRGGALCRNSVGAGRDGAGQARRGSGHCRRAEARPGTGLGRRAVGDRPGRRPWAESRAGPPSRSRGARAGPGWAGSRPRWLG